MPLTMRPTGLGFGIDKDRPDYTVYCGGWEVGRIYQTRGGPESLRWFWSMTVNGPMTRSDRVPTLEEPRNSFRKVGMLGRRGPSWKRCLKRRPLFFYRSLLPPGLLRLANCLFNRKVFEFFSLLYRGHKPSGLSAASCPSLAARTTEFRRDLHSL
jgi:hypothetical protein